MKRWGPMMLVALALVTGLGCGDDDEEGDGASEGGDKAECAKIDQQREACGKDPIECTADRVTCYKKLPDSVCASLSDDAFGTFLSCLIGEADKK